MPNMRLVNVLRFATLCVIERKRFFMLSPSLFSVAVAVAIGLMFYRRKRRKKRNKQTIDKPATTGMKHTRKIVEPI